MTKTILDVGNCGPDHSAIRRLFEGSFQAEVLQAHNAQDTFQMLRSRSIDLVLVNRKLDEDYSDGIEIIKAIKADSELSSVPVMLITNYEEHQEQAMSIGALRGFGKLSMKAPETLKLIESALR